MRRREFIVLLGAAAFCPLAAHAQQTDRAKRIGVLMLYAEKDPAGQTRAGLFRDQLEKLGWALGRNLQINFHWGVGDDDWVRSAIAEMLRLSPDVILANGGHTVRPAQQATRTTPIIFIGTADPVAEGLVRSLASPGGNITGFAVLEPSHGPKLLELLKQIAPRVKRVAVLINPDSSSNRLLVSSATIAAKALGVEVVVAPVRGPSEIEGVIAPLGREPDCGLVVLPDPSTNAQRRLIIDLAAQYRLPAIHALRAATAEGALISYGVDIPELFRQAADYANRILRGEKPAELPVQQAKKFELIVNLKTARALGLEVSPTLLATADELIE